MERDRWGTLFGLSDDQLEFFGLHTEADIEHSNLGWHAVAEHATRLGLEDAVVEASGSATSTASPRRATTSVTISNGPRRSRFLL